MILMTQVNFCINHLDKIAVNISSHNEKSNLIAIEQLRKIIFL